MRQMDRGCPVGVYASVGSSRLFAFWGHYFIRRLIGAAVSGRRLHTTIVMWRATLAVQLARLHVERVALLLRSKHPRSNQRVASIMVSRPPERLLRTLVLITEPHAFSLHNTRNADNLPLVRRTAPVQITLGNVYGDRHFASASSINQAVKCHSRRNKSRANRLTAC